MTVGRRFERAFDVVMSQIVGVVAKSFWRIYGAFFESIARKYYELQSHSEGGELYLVDRRTGRPIPEFDTRRKRV